MANKSKYLLVQIDQPVQFLHGGHFISSGEWTHPTRKLNNYEIIVGYEGVAHIQVGEEQFRVKPGDVLAIPEGYPHKGYQVSNEKVSFYWMHFTGQVRIIDQEEQQELFMKIESTKELDNQIMVLPLYEEFSSTHRLGILFNQLIHLQMDQHYREVSRNYLATSYLLELHQMTYDKWLLGRHHENADRKLRTMMEWVKANSHQAINHETVAENFNYNKNYLNRYFKKGIGLSVNQYVQSVRIEKAKELLYSSHKQIKEIGYEVGFNDEKHFLKTFKKSTGMTPSQYRNVYHDTFINTF